jgi:putative PEP-CTERM system histidine kinase
MQPAAVDLSTWSALLAGLAYTAFAFHLLRSGSLKPAKGRSSLLFAGAIVSSAAWGWAGVLAGFDLAANVAVQLFDLLRYAFWFAFILSVLAPVLGERRQSSLALLAPAAAIIVVAGAALLALGYSPGDRDRVALFEALALPLFGLVLVEQFFRNISDESRWNAKPLCLGLCVILFFDAYLYSEAVLFSKLDADAVSIRSGIHALAVPLLFISSRRGRDWIARLKLSRKAAFHSAALVLAGVYLLFVALVGYYIRFFGGEWGGALQLASLSIAVTALVVLAVSGTMRSRLRVLIGKHFFNYRYDYREEWLRFTTMLSAKSSPSEMGILVIRGMADMVESPSGALWTVEPGQTEYVQTARWNSPASSDREPTDSSLSEFLRSTGWIIDLERYRAGTEHYAELTLPPWLASATQHWLAIPLLVGEELLGFVTLGPARTRVDVNWEVTDC